MKNKFTLSGALLLSLTAYSSTALAQGFGPVSSVAPGSPIGQAMFYGPNNMSRSEAEDQLRRELVGKKLTSMIGEQLKGQNGQLQFRDLEESLKTVYYFWVIREAHNLLFTMKRGKETFNFSCLVTDYKVSNTYTLKPDCDVTRSSNGKALSESEKRREGLEIKGFDLNAAPIFAQVEATLDSQAVTKLQAKKQGETVHAQVNLPAENSASGAAAH